MAVQVIVGAQWGDEGKGKVVDLLAGNADVVARYGGGANAGHTVRIGTSAHVLHLIPSGIFHPRCTCIIGTGVVLDPEALLEEMDTLRRAGVPPEGRLLISGSAHLILPYHRMLDAARERTPGRIGTTGRGIGPAYMDKAARTGLRVADLLDADLLERKLRSAVAEKNLLLAALYGEPPLDAGALLARCLELRPLLEPFVADTALFLHRALGQDRKIIAEGAQGALLDLDHGTYPYVTSSSTASGGACTGLGIPPTAIREVLGVVKAYSTRVGEGPFPTELPPSQAEELRRTGGEFGATTGRPRRCGWFDAAAVRHAVRVSGISAIALTKLDVLDGMKEIPVCTGYEGEEKDSGTFPWRSPAPPGAVPRYRTFEGWCAPTGGMTRYGDLPAAARRYAEGLAELTGTRLALVSVGPGREQTVVPS
ncbi:MAG: adenylosuccinate synthase [Bacteroidota bacterium]